jgi:hypothetical protein
MLIKIIAFLAAAIPIVLFLRAVFFRKPTRMSENLKAFKRQLDLGVWIFLGLIAIVSAIALGRLAWAWLTTG